MINDYIQHGFKLVPLLPGGKSPIDHAWNKPGNELKSAADLPAGCGVGLMHAYSGTMALDIDDVTTAQQLLEPHIDLLGLVNASNTVLINSGRKGRLKLLFQTPFSLPTKQIRVENKIIYELRCATSDGVTVQDVIPPSIHPDTLKPYVWGGTGHWSKLPMIPQKLLDFWFSLVNDPDLEDVQGVSVCEWEEVQEALMFVSPTINRADWITIGMAIHWLAETKREHKIGFKIWDEWSSRCEKKYPGRSTVLKQWKSFKISKKNTVKIGSLFHIASKLGWVRKPSEKVALLFSDITKTPHDFHNSLRPSAPVLDLSLFPDILKKRAEEVSEGIGCDPIVPLWAALSSVCAVADSQIRLELMDGYKVPPILWLMTIGEPADKKSPGSRPMMSVLREIEMEDIPRYKRDLLTWEGKEAAYASAKKNFLQFCGDPQNMLSEEEIPHVPEQPIPPVSLKLTVSDITSQKLVRVAAERPRGVLCYLDEMNSWIRKLIDKQSGEDRSTWVVSYESASYDMDRVGGGSIHCSNLAVSVFGNIQPDVLKLAMKSMAADGLLQRFIPAVLRPEMTRLGYPKPENQTLKKEWDQVLRLIFSLPPITYRLSSDGLRDFREFQMWYENRKKDERLLSSSSMFMTAFGKLEGTAGRLILVFHLIENPFSSSVDAKIVRRVIRLIKSYIIPSFRFTFNQLAEADSFDVWLSDYIIQHSDTDAITMGQIRGAARFPLEGLNYNLMTQKILLGMNLLEEANWVKRKDDQKQEKMGIAEWVINPTLKTLFAEHRTMVIDAKRRIFGH